MNNCLQVISLKAASSKISFIQKIKLLFSAVFLMDVFLIDKNMYENYF